MKKKFLLGAMVCALVIVTSCKSECPWEGKMVIHPGSEIKTDTIAIDSTYLPWCAEVAIKGYSKDTLYLSFCNGSFWKVKLIGNIDTTYRNDWYNEILPVTYHTRTANDSDSVIIKYSFGI